MELICVGDNVTDYYPQKNVFFPGGSTFNVAIQAARYGLKTAYIGTFGNDISGRHQLKVLENEGVDTSHTNVITGRNAISKVINRDGESKIIKVDKGVYRQFYLTEKDLKYIKNYKYVHSTIYSYTEKYLPEFKKMGLTVSFDYSFKSTAEYLENTVSWVDIAFFSAKNINTDLKDFMSCVNKMGPEYVIITMGNKGVLALLKNKYYYQPSVQVDVIDTLGAGDAFIAMFLNCFIKGLSPSLILKKSSKSAAECCKEYGAVGWSKKPPAGYGFRIDI